MFCTSFSSAGLTEQASLLIHIYIFICRGEQSPSDHKNHKLSDDSSEARAGPTSLNLTGMVSLVWQHFIGPQPTSENCSCITPDGFCWKFCRKRVEASGHKELQKFKHQFHQWVCPCVSRQNNSNICEEWKKVCTGSTYTNVHVHHWSVHMLQCKKGHAQV